MACTVGSIDVLTEFFNKSCHNRILENDDDSFYICEVGQVIKQHKRWCGVFPRIRPHYAVKCNPNEVVLKAMLAMGMGFDCASKAEIGLLLSLGAKPEDIIYANPCKQISHLSYAEKENVKQTVFDSKEELDKIKKYFPGAQTVLRIKTDDSTAQCPLSQKYGADIDDCPSLIDYAKTLDLNVIGISFHVGSGCRYPSIFTKALNDSRKVFDYAEKVGYHFTLLDIGGGFPGTDHDAVTFEEIADVVNRDLEQLFPENDYEDLELIAEPGRYYVTMAFTLVTSVIGKRILTVNREKGEADVYSTVYNYHINEGLFGGFNMLYYDHAEVFPIVQNKNGHDKHLSNIWGPTRTTLDKVLTDVLLPELEVDDKLVWKDMGAYSQSSSSSYEKEMDTSIKYVISQDDVFELVKFYTQSAKP